MIMAIDKTGHEQFSRTVDEVRPKELGHCLHRAHVGNEAAVSCQISIMKKFGSRAGENCAVGKECIHGFWERLVIRSYSE